MIIKSLIAFLFLSISNGLIAQVNKDSLKELEWILGTWKRQNSKPGQTHHEKWWKVSDQHLQGIGVVMEGLDTVFIEKLGIKIEEGKVYYIADVPENAEPVYFKFTNSDGNSFVSENLEHDVPKKIAYYLEGSTLTAKVSWDNGGFEAVFVKLE
jgi:hypothetical protein